MDIETYISRYQPKSNISLQRLLFLACTTKDQNASTQGFELLEQRLKQRGNTKMYRQVFFVESSTTSTLSSEEMMMMMMDGDASAGTTGTTTAAAEFASMNVDNGTGSGEATSNSMTSGEFVAVSLEFFHEYTFIYSSHSNPSKTKNKNQFKMVKKKEFNKPRGIPIDTQFLQNVEMNAANQLQTLEANLSNSQAHLSKDSIRNSYLALAKFFQSRGESETAIRYYQRAKEYCFSQSGGSGIGGGDGASISATNPTNEILLSLVECCLEAQKGYYDEMVVTLIDGTSESSSDYIFNNKLKCARGIAYLNKNDYYHAATSFLSIAQIDFNNQYNSVLCAEDIALYGGILGLIVLDRNKIEALLDVEAWRERLELVPNLQDAIKCYMKADYGGCLRLMDPIKDLLIQDLFLNQHVDSLWKMMREKCILQYFQPYSSVSLITMKDSFGFANVDEVEDIVSSLIESKRLVGAKIDGVNRTLTRITAKGFERMRRQMMMKRVNVMGDRLINEVEDAVLRMSCVENNIVVLDDTKRRGIGRDTVGGMMYEGIGGYSSDDEIYAM